MVRSAAVLGVLAIGLFPSPTCPNDGDRVFVERNGVIAVEAEHFFKQTKTDIRRWAVTTADASPIIRPDGDPPHIEGASGGAYLEALPDTRRSHDDKLIHGQNFSNEPGTMAVLHYKVRFTTPGRYYVWTRVFSTNTEDNSLHVGIDGAWPGSGNGSGTPSSGQRKCIRE